MKKIYNKGFTLLEMIVSIGLFLTVLFATTSAFLAIVNADRASRSARMTMDNLNVALEDMVRLLKTGVGYTVTGGNTINFIDQDGRSVRYALEGKTITRKINSEAPLPAIADNINITNLQFLVNGITPGDLEQPSVLIQIAGEMASGKNLAPFTMQTMVTQRAYDL